MRILIPLLALLAGCQGVLMLPGLSAHKIDIQQGNYVTQEMMDKLKPGMAKSQVRFALGTPLVTDPFHADRWDYVFTLKRQGVDSQTYKYTVVFKGDQLESFAGDAMPSEAEFIAKLDNKRKLGKVPPLEASEEQLKAAEKPSSAKPASGAAVAAPPADPQTTVYPPLESPKQ